VSQLTVFEHGVSLSGVHPIFHLFVRGCPYGVLVDELIEFLVACHLRCVCGVAGVCELRMKY
jgi:hypothetical protein